MLKAGAAFLMVNPTAKAQKLEFLLRQRRAPRDRAAGVAAWRRWPGVLRRSRDADASSWRWALRRTAPDAKSSATPADALPPGPTARAADADDRRRPGGARSTPPVRPGEPKGVMLTHANIARAIDSIATLSRLDARTTCMMNVLPLSFGYGL